MINMNRSEEIVEEALNVGEMLITTSKQAKDEMRELLDEYAQIILKEKTEKLKEKIDGQFLRIKCKDCGFLITHVITVKEFIDEVMGNEV